MIKGIVTFQFEGRSRVANLISQEEGGAWVETGAGTRLFVPADDIVTPEQEQAQQEDAALAKLVERWTSDQQRNAAHIVWEYEREAARHAEELPGEWERRHAKEHAQNVRENDLATVRKQFELHAEKRRLRWLELDAWAKRQRVISEFGSGAVMVPLFEQWLKQIDKIMPTKKAQKEVRWLEEAVDPPIRLFSTVTLDFVDNLMTAYVWSVDKAKENAGYGLAAFRERLECRVDHPFTARVDFKTLFLVVKEMSPERADFRLGKDHLELWTEVNHNRLTLVPMHPATEAFWFGFPEAPEETPAPKQTKPKKKRSRYQDTVAAIAPPTAAPVGTVEASNVGV